MVARWVIENPRRDLVSYPAKLAAAIAVRFVGSIGPNPSAARLLKYVTLVRAQRALFVTRLFLATLVAHDALIMGATILGPRLGLWHTLLPAVFSALILLTFKVVFFGHVALHG